MKVHYIVSLMGGPKRKAALRGEDPGIRAMIADIPSMEILGGDELSGIEVLLDPEKVPLLRERVGKTCHVEEYEDLRIPEDLDVFMGKL